MFGSGKDQGPFSSHRVQQASSFQEILYIAPSTRHTPLFNPMQSLRSDSDDAKNAAEIDTSKPVSEPSHRNACSLGM